MNDDNQSQPQNQPPQVPPIEEPQSVQPQQGSPVYETIEIGNNSPEAPQPLQPEEIAPDVSTPDEATQPQAPTEIPPGDMPPPVYEENKSKYFIIAGGVVFFLILFVLFLKLLLGGKSAPKVTLTYWGLWESKDVMDPLIKEYQSKNPNITINYQQMVPTDNYREKLVARGKNGQGPDIFRFHNTWLPELTEVVAPLPSQIISNNDFEKTFYPVQAQDLKIASNYYGIPLEMDGLVLIYNDDLLKKGGYSKPPANLDELANPDFLSKFTFKNETGQLQSSAIALGTATNVEHFSDILGLMLVQNGTDIKSLDSQEAQGALESYRKFAETGIWDDTMDNSIVAFAKGKVAMIIAPTWEIQTIKAANPDIKLKVAPIPFNLPGNQPKSLANYWVEGVSKYSNHQIEAWNFLKFLSSKESETKLFELESKTRLFGEPFSRIDLADKLTSNQYLSVIAQEANDFVSMPVISRTYDNGLNDEIVTYLENAVNATAQGVSYAEALGTAKQGVDQVLQKYNIK